MSRACAVCAHQPRVTQNPEMMRHTRLWAPAVELSACRLGHMRQPLHDLQANRVAERVKYAFQLELIGCRVLERSHAFDSTLQLAVLLLFEYYRTMENP